jgi:hypothetical protein
MGRQSLVGRKQSAEHIAKRVASCRASGGYAAQGERFSLFNKSRVGIGLSEEHKRKIAESMLGKQNCLGNKLSIEHRQKLSAYWQAHPEKHNHYKDGKWRERVGERLDAMQKLGYRIWRETVFKRDDWTCVWCGVRGGKMHAHHVQSWRDYPKLRYEISNGITLCATCHFTTRKSVC